MSERTASADETLARITELARRALEAQASFARQSFELGRATLQGDVDRSSAGRAYLDAVNRETAQFWRELSVLGLDYASEVMALGSRTVARIISDTNAAGARSGTRQGRPRPQPPADSDSSEDGQGPSSPSSEATGRHVAVTLRAAAGATARATVTVANRHPRTRRVTLTPSELRDVGGTAIAVPLKVDPERVTIPAGGEEQVALSVELAADLVQPGQRYVGTVEVSGGDEATLEVTVEVAT